MSAPSNGAIQGSVFTDGATVVHTCNTGYHLTGYGLTHCLATNGKNAIWDHEAPKCVDINTVVCAPPETEHQHLRTDHNDFTAGKTIKLSCISGWALIGADTIKCESSGRWSHALPTCSSACKSFSVNNGKTTPAGPIFSPGTSVKVTCDQGFRLIGAADLRCSSTNTSWTVDTFPTCNKGCSAPKIPKDSKLSTNAGNKTDFGLGDAIRWICPEGMVVKGDESSTCQKDFSWSPAAPDCISGCPPPRAPTNGVVEPASGGQPVGTVAKWKCKDGFKLVGSASTTCGPKGWTGLANTPVCEKESKSKTWLIGPIAGGIVLLLLIIGVVCMMRKKAKKKKQDQQWREVQKTNYNNPITPGQPVYGTPTGATAGAAAGAGAGAAAGAYANSSYPANNNGASGADYSSYYGYDQSNAGYGYDQYNNTGYDQNNSYGYGYDSYAQPAASGSQYAGGSYGYDGYGDNGSYSYASTAGASQYGGGSQGYGTGGGDYSYGAGGTNYGY
eukprot:TRINITY_DN66774_c5_g9_i1.p1 TRINITY_DN66774_c5_g9~~TRINITY_DN66774_c5_g9_i1.p1  ORF type:complete len:538 (+),score=99.04 TRINITY_DN66774_c5_g9_i1:114-1616(+)